ncbi:MAG: DNRLRE domain-containing protein [Woeseiaceae bacterium]
MNILGQTGSAAMALFLCSVHGWADTVSLPLTDDAFTLGTRPTANYGAWDDIFVTSYGPKQGLIRFDAASIAGQEINGASFNLYLNDIANGGTISVYAITSSWSESAVNWDNQPPVEAAATAVVDLATADEGSIITIDVTDAATRWADGSLADAGFLIVTSDNIKAYFDAQEKVGGIPVTLEVDTGPPAYSGEAIVLDLSNPDGCIIDEPGYYVLDRSWLLSPGGTGGAAPNASCGPVHISSAGVTLDLRGFAIWVGLEWGAYEPVLWIDTAGGVTLRNGTLTGINVAIEASVAGGTDLLDRIRTGGGVLLDARRVIVTGGSYWGYWEAPLQMGEGSRVVGAALECVAEVCVTARGSSLIRDCTFTVDEPSAPAIVVTGDGTIVEGNSFDSWVSISGNRNVVARNFSSSGDPYIEVKGSGNVVDGNIGPGIVFEAPGNFYGNNRVALPGSITGTDGNVDWGGNVSY